jgi:hypothetical protein
MWSATTGSSACIATLTSDMKSFDSFAFDLRKCRAELDELLVLLNSQPHLQERKDVLPFFRARRHLSAFIGSYFPYLASPDRIAYEYDLFGDFACDLAIGDSTTGQYCFVEFEDATASSLFVAKGAKATLEWSPRFEHGFSQVLDWFWKLNDQEGSTEFVHRFGLTASYEGMLIIGRSTGLSHKERDRLRWRRDKVVSDSKRVHCVTYDELYQHLDSRLKLYEPASAADS